MAAHPRDRSRGESRQDTIVVLVHTKFVFEYGSGAWPRGRCELAGLDAKDRDESQRIDRGPRHAAAKSSDSQKAAEALHTPRKLLREGGKISANVPFECFIWWAAMQKTKTPSLVDLCILIHPSSPNRTDCFPKAAK